jgi:rhomboid protease GluP
VGGLVNLLVLKTLPPQTELIGISGVVYWMGAAWLTLHLLIDHREKLRRRFGGALFLTLFLFVPETIHPEVSYLTHFLGFVSGALSACLYYWLRRQQFQAAEIVVYAFEPHPEEEPEKGFYSHYE